MSSKKSELKLFIYTLQIPDGVYSIAVGKLSWLSNQVTIIGSNCSITIIDGEGNEVFWTIMGGIVRSLAIFDFDGDGEFEVKYYDTEI